MSNELTQYGKKNKKRLKDFRCPAPFRDLMVFEKSTSVCCPEWFDIEQLKKDFPKDFDSSSARNFPWEVSKLIKTDVIGNWNNKFHTKLREAIGKGDYKYCSLMCPWLNKINSASEHDIKNTFYKTPKNSTLEYYEKHLKHLKLPKRVYFNFDTSCNLKCPSCRIELHTNTMNIENKKVLDAIDKQLGQGIQYITITGSGDPFYSNIFRNWLSETKEKKYPNLREIFIVSNGNMFTPKIWESIKPSHRYIKGMEWSIDAATKDTYENKTRLNGKWDKLMDNFSFLEKLSYKHLFGGLTFSFVIQDHNYHEISAFVDLIESKAIKTKFKKIMFRAIQDWGHQSKEWMKQRNVCDPSHPEHSKFLEEFKKVQNNPLVDSNVFHLLDSNPKFDTALI